MTFFIGLVEFAITYVIILLWLTTRVIMLKVKVTTVGNSVGITFPKEALSHLNVHKGDYLYLVETHNGYELTPYDQEFIAQMTLAEQIMKEDRVVLRVLGQGLKSNKSQDGNSDADEFESNHR